MPVRAIVTEGTGVDCIMAEYLIDGLPVGNLLSDKSYDSNAIVEKTVRTSRDSATQKSQKNQNL